MRQVSKQESLQDALKLSIYTVEQMLSVFGGPDTEHETQLGSGYRDMLYAELLKTMTFEDLQWQFALTRILKELKELT